MTEFGRHGSARQTVERARSLAFLLMAVTAPLAALAMPFIPWFTNAFIPHYAPSSSAMQLALLIGVVRIFTVATSVYSTLAAWKEMFVNQGVLWVTQIVGAVGGGLLMANKPWLGITAGLLAAYVLYVPVTLWSLASVARRSEKTLS